MRVCLHARATLMQVVYFNRPVQDGDVHLSAPFIYADALEELSPKPGMSFLNIVRVGEWGGGVEGVRQADRHEERPKERQTDRGRYRQADRERERDREEATETERDRDRDRDRTRCLSWLRLVCLLSIISIRLYDFDTHKTRASKQDFQDFE